MSAVIPPSGWPANMSADDRKVWLHEQIAKWVGEKKIEDCLSALELGNLSMTEKMVAYRSILIMDGIRHCRNNPRAEARIPILTLIVYLSDNAKGTCTLTLSKMQELLQRSRQSIVDNILALEKDGSIGIVRIGGMPNRYWPRIPSALVQMGPNPTWFVEAVAGKVPPKIYNTVDEAIAAASDDQSSGVDQSRYRSSAADRTSHLQQTNQSSPAGEPVKSSTDSISSLNLSSLSNAKRGPHLTPTGFVLSADHEFIPLEIFEDWRRRFPYIRDLEAKVQKLASVILKKGVMHPGWTNPEAWMAGCLADDNQKAADDARIMEAKVASAQRGQPAKTFRR
jgi:hypothetical protein